MDYAEVKSEIREIAEIAASVPEQFREKCFEVLLSHLLKGSQRSQHSSHTDASAGNEPDKTNTMAGTSHSSHTIPAQVRVFMKRTSITEDNLKSILMLEDGEVHFIQEPKPSSIAQGQVQWALLLALKNGLLANNLSVDPEDVRSICQDKGYYDAPNFAANFKSTKVKPLFKGLMKPQGESQALTNDGQSELAALITTLAAKVK